MAKGFEQLSLAVQLKDPATFDNFFVGKNQLLVNELKRQLDQGDRFIFITGNVGDGRSHLLQAACHYADQQDQTAFYLSLADHQSYQAGAIFDELDGFDLVCLDDIDAVIGLNQWEEALFHLFNRLADNAVCLLMASNQTPRQLSPNLADLGSRLSAGSLYQVKISDNHYKDVFTFRAGLRGIEISQELLQFIDYRCQRDTTALIDLLDRLDEASLKEKRKLTIPFVKSVMGW